VADERGAGEPSAAERIEAELSRCVRCGTCMAICPVYEFMQREGGVARGKLALIRAQRDGALDDDALYRHFLTSCLLCNRCKSSCPNQVDTAAIVQAARADLADRGRIGRIKRFVLRRLLPGRRAVPALLKGARASRPLWAARVPGHSGLHIRFLRTPDGRRRRLPPIARPFFLERELPAAPPADDAERVVLFIGCVNNYLRPQAAAAALELLAGAGARVAVPRDQACCGMPAYSSGEVSGARRLAARNVDALLPAGAAPPAAVTSPCATCAHMLKAHLPALLADDPERAARARLLAERVVPFSRVWARFAGARREGAGRLPDAGRVPITFHDPCHLSRGFGEKDAPRLILTRLRAAYLVEMCHPCRCCGHGGAFNLAHYDLSTAMGEDKARRALATGARAVVTECSGCVLQLAEAVGRLDPEVEVMTTAEAALRFDLDGRQRPEDEPAGSGRAGGPAGCGADKAGCGD
jgi:glycolate oxidase iron-sulfur subunit